MILIIILDVSKIDRKVAFSNKNKILSDPNESFSFRFKFFLRYKNGTHEGFPHYDSMDA